MHKSQLLDTLHIERARWESVLEQVGEERLTLHGVVGDWSIKGVIAHIMSYEQYLLDRMCETLRGDAYVPSETPEALLAFLEQYDYPDFGSALLDDDEPNAWVIQRYRGEPLEAVIAKERQVYAELVQAIESLSDEAFESQGYAVRIESNTTEHYQHHANDIQNWLRSLSG